MGVNFGGGNGLMPQHFLQDAQISASFYKNL